MIFHSSDKRVGSATKTRRYDLPLHQDEGTGFLVVLVGLMAFLSTIVLSFSFSLNQVMDGWSQGLENKVTIEIPAKTDSHDLRGAPEIARLQSAILDKLSPSDSIKTIEPVSDETLHNLVQSWLGQSSFFDELPMPALISVELYESSPSVVNALTQVVKGVDTHALIDTHESWLDDLYRLTGSLQAAILVIVLVIGLTTVAAIAGAMKSQIEIHRDDVELLHLMGAQDNYITRQFIRHAGILSLSGAFGGVVAAVVILGLIGLFFRAQAYSFMPTFSIDPAHGLVLGLTPLVICIISAISARFTVLRVLQRMP